MAITRNSKQVFWSGAVTVSVAAGGNATSDDVLISDNAVGLSIIVKADNAGTPAAGDEIRVYVLYSSGDPDADPNVADEFATPKHAFPVGVLDTNQEDPAALAVRLSPEFKAFRLYVENGSATNAITVSAEAYETLSS